MPSIDILANTRAAQTNVKDLSKALDGVSDSLDGVAKDGSASGDKLEATFRDMVREAKKTDDAIDNIGTTSKKGFGKASEASGEFKNEALANFSEVTSSFDGSMQSVGDLAQGTLGGVASSIPGIGLAAGVLAAGIGGITSRFGQLQDRAKEVTDGIISDFVDLGNALDAEAVNSRVKDILKVEDTRKEAEMLHDILGITVGQAALAMAGDFEAAGVTVDQVMQGIANAPGNVNYDTWINLKNTLDATNKGLEYGSQAANAAADAMDRKSRSDLDAAIATGKVTEEVDNLNNHLYTLPDGKQILINADTGKATSDVSKFKGDVDGATEPVTKRVSIELDDSAIRHYRPPTIAIPGQLTVARGSVVMY